MSPNLAYDVIGMGDDEQTSDILPKPVVLLPLQMEIRHFEKSVPIIPDIAIFDSSTTTYSSIQQIMENVNLPLNIIKKQFKEEIEEEFWIRWYPDEIQYGSPIGKFSDEELLKWSRYEKQWMNCKSERGEKLEEEKKRIDVEKVREELKDLISGYSTNVPKEIREIILQETNKGAQKVNDFKKSGEELFGVLDSDLTKIVENKDDDNIKIAAINRKIYNTFKKIGSKIPSLIETSGKLNNFNNLAANAQNQLSTNLQNSFRSNLDPNARKKAFNELNQGHQANITREIINIINQDVNELKSIKSANKIGELTEKLVDDAIDISQIPDEKKRAKRTELVQFLQTAEKNATTLYVNFVDRLLVSDDYADTRSDDNSMFLDIVKTNAAKMMDTFGVTRARQLAKNMFLNEEGKSWDFDTDAVDEEGNRISDPLQLFLTEGIQIKTLPNYLVLYTIKNETYTKLGEPIEIQRDNIVVRPIDQNSWMSDFEKAITLGMGIKITDQAQVKQIKNADWLIAVGFSESEEIHEHFEELFKRRNAAGELSIVAQDSPTNNTEEEKTTYTSIETDISDHFENTRTTIKPIVGSDIPYKGAIKELSNNFSDAQILTNILRFDPSTLGDIEGADLHEQNEATAMNMFLWDACLHKFKWLWENKLNNTPKWGPMGQFQFSWGQLSNFCLENLRARGNFPVIRVGKNPYGILPVMALKGYKPIESIGEDARVLDYLSLFCKSLMKEGIFPSSVNMYESSKGLVDPDRVPSIEDIVEDLEDNLDKNGSLERLLDNLGTTRVSKELNVRLMNPEDIFRPIDETLPIACSLVKDEIGVENIPDLPENINSETSYLHLLSQMSTPFSINELRTQYTTTNPPVLKRIIYYLIEHINEIERIVPDEQIISLAAMLKYIDPNKLEILLMEFFDLFSHRLDAWVTSLAHERLIKYLDESDDIRPNIGVYGWLEKPGKIRSTPTFTPEYIQAPSQDQAVATALLRNASLLGDTDDPDGPFRINLSSDQVKKGMEYFEGLREKHSAEELLGYQVERYIHDNKNELENLDELDIYRLRQVFPLRLQRGINRDDTVDDDDNRTFVETVINGIEFLEATLDLHNKRLRKVYDKDSIILKKTAFAKVQAEVRKTSDAAADIALAEVVYQFTRGNMERVKGWLDFVDGDVQPPKPEFVKAHRTGDRHGTKTFLIVEPPSDIANTFNQPEPLNTPRKIVAPIVDHFCNTILGDISDSCNVSAKVTTSINKQVFCVNCIHFTNETENPDYCEVLQTTKVGDFQRDCADFTSQFDLENIPFTALQFEAIDLLIGGIPELELRIKYYILQNWSESPAYKPFLGDYFWNLNPGELLNKFSIELTFDAESSSIIEKTRLLRKFLHQNIKSNLEVSSEPHEDFKIISEDNYKDIDLFKTIEILLKRTDVILTRYLNLYEYMADVFFHSTKLMVFYNLTRLKWCLENKLDHINTHHLWRSLANELDELFQISPEISLGDLLPDYFERIADLNIPIQRGEGIMSGARPAAPPPGTGTPPRSTQPPIPVQREPILSKKYIDWIVDIITYNEDPEYIDQFSGFMKNLIEVINGMSFESPDYNILKERLREVSRYGYTQALIPFLEFESIDYSNTHDVASLNTFKNMLKNLVIFLKKRIITVINRLNELSNKDASSDVKWNIVLNQLKELTYKDATSDDNWITTWLESNTFNEEMKKFCPWCGASIKSEDIICGDCDKDLVSEVRPEKPFWKIQFRVIKGKQIIKKLISVLQGATDERKIMLFTPYVLWDTSNKKIKDWSLNLESFNLQSMREPGNSLEKYVTVRKKINDVLYLFKDDNNHDLYEDRYELPSVLDKSNWEGKREDYSNSDYLYISPFAKRESIKCFACVYIDDWVEFFPYMTETTGIAYRYDAPQTEAPNAILLAISPKPSDTEGWTPQNPDILAQTLLETIDLMKTRMVSSNAMIFGTGLGKVFPALLFDSSDIGLGSEYHNALFPQEKEILLDILSKKKNYMTTMGVASALIDYLESNSNNNTEE